MLRVLLCPRVCVCFLRFHSPSPDSMSGRQPSAREAFSFSSPPRSCCLSPRLPAVSFALLSHMDVRSSARKAYSPSRPPVHTRFHHTRRPYRCSAKWQSDSLLTRPEALPALPVHVPRHHASQLLRADLRRHCHTPSQHHLGVLIRHHSLNICSEETQGAAA